MEAMHSLTELAEGLEPLPEYAEVLAALREAEKE